MRKPDHFFAPGSIESTPRRSKWWPVVREWLICLVIAVAFGTASAFFNSRI